MAIVAVLSVAVGIKRMVIDVGDDGVEKTASQSVIVSVIVGK